MQAGNSYVNNEREYFLGKAEGEFVE